MKKLSQAVVVVGVLTCFLTISFPLTSLASGNLPVALVYKGPGSCEEDCSEASAQMAELAGFSPVYIGPNDTNPNLFADAKVYIQPGGNSWAVGVNMHAKLKKNIRDFVANGGGYVGFCAGAFYSAETISGYPRLDLISANATFYKWMPTSPNVAKFTYKGQTRHIYWEGGPYVSLYQGSGFEVTSRYPNGLIAGVQGPYHNGRVSVVGQHPEAPQWWREDPLVEDPDGLDFDIAVDMIHWVTKTGQYSVL